MSRNEDPNTKDPHASPSWKGPAIFALVSIFLHLLIIPSYTYLLYSKSETKPSKKRFMQLQRMNRVSRAKRARRMAIAKKLIKQYKKKTQKPKPRPSKPRGQVVDVAPTKDRTPPKNARFLSEHNTRVKKQSISRHRRLKYKRAMQQPTKRRRGPTPRKAYLSKRTRRTKQLKTRGRGRKRRGKRQKQVQRKRTKRASNRKPGKAIPKRARRNLRKFRQKNSRGRYNNTKERFALSGKTARFRLGIGPLKIQTPIAKSSPGGDGGRGIRPMPNMIDLRPNMGTLSRIQGAPAPDHVKNVQQGEATLLNSRRWLYASFFNRVKRLVAQHWSPATKYRRRDPYGNIYGVKDRMTVLTVVLKKSGELVDIRVKRSSGLRFLDKEAILSFKRAQPFPNPPVALSSGDGKIRFTFGFLLELSSKPRFLMFRR